MRDKVSCGFNKWSIEIGDNAEITIKFNRIPIEGSVSLYDLSVEDARNIGEMFISFAHSLDQQEKNKSAYSDI